MMADAKSTGLGRNPRGLLSACLLHGLRQDLVPGFEYIMGLMKEA